MVNLRTCKPVNGRSGAAGRDSVRPGGGKARAQHQFVEQAAPGGGFTAPGDLWKTKLQPAERTADGNVGQAQRVATAKRLVAQTLAHGLKAGVDLAQLALDPGLAAFAVLA